MKKFRLKLRLTFGLLISILVLVGLGQNCGQTKSLNPAVPEQKVIQMDFKSPSKGLLERSVEGMVVRGK